MHQGGQAVQPLRRRVAGDVAEVNCQLPALDPDIVKIDQEQRGGERRVDGERYAHQFAEIFGIIFEIGKPGRIVDGAEVVAQRDPQRVAQMPVSCRSLAKRGQQRTDVIGVRLP